MRGALAANVLGVLDETAQPMRHRLEAGEDLATVVSQLPTGATLTLPAGRFRVGRTLALIQDVTIQGAGQGRTVVTTSADGAGLVLTSQVALRMRGLRMEHRGPGAASVLLLRAGTAELDDVAITGATRAAPVAPGSRAVLTGGSGIVLAGADQLTMRDSASSGNAVAGLLVATGAARVRSSTFSGNDVCGVCYLGNATGRLSGSRVSGNGAGVMLGERSAPALTDNEIEQNQEAGVVVEGRTRARLRGNLMRDNGPLGVAVYGSASPLLGGNTLVAHDQAGILLDVVASATPRVLGNLLRDNGSAGLVLTGRSTGTVADNICTGARFGLVLDGAADPDLDDNDCAIQDQRDQGRD